MSGHKPPHGGHHIDTKARHERQKAKHKLYLGLRKDAHSGYRRASK